MSQYSSLNKQGMEAAFASHTEEVWLVFLSISHPDLIDGTIRLVQNTEAVTRQGNSYSPTFFDITLPGQHDKRSSSAQISIPNIDRKITDSLRPLMSSDTLVEVDISVALATSPDETQHGPWLLGLRNVTWDAEHVSAELVPLLDLDQEWPVVRMDQARFPGLYPN